ncbi:LysR family transcriptional regulator [Saccharospirillum alexandrii]|uniref:LysR family transcriptional regulator n=1 Tax=Saccharospirillum alexandrii TaxID=2448477 RepID=UPI003736ADAF
MDRFNAMQAFIRVVETGSFTKAADTLHMNKTSVTQLVQQLEAHLRVKLLNRTTRKVNVTADGAAYYERAVKLLADMEDAETNLPSAITAPSGRLRVDVPSPLARFILIPALPSFYAQYPDIQLDLGVSDRVVDIVGEGVDCVLRGGELADLSLVARRVGSLPFGLYASPGYLEQFGTPVHPNELAGPHHCVVGFTWERIGKALPYVLKQNGESTKVQGRNRISVDDGNAHLAAGMAGLGVLSLPVYMANEAVARNELIPLFEDWQLDPMPMYVAFPQNRYISAKLRVFIDWVSDLMKPVATGRN